MDNPKISVIVPVYNVEHYIRECFSSIAAQTYKGKIECIFVDDCGQDRSVDILEELIADYHGSISFSVIHHEHNKGLSGARNTGIRNATGDYLYFLDSDDTITPDCIERLAELAEKYPGVEVVQGSTQSNIDLFCLENKNIDEYYKNFKWIRRAFLQRYTIPVTAWNKLVRKDFILSNALYFKEGLIHEDELWNFFLAKYTKRMAFCKTNTYIYRENPNGIVKNIADQQKSFIPVLKEMFKNMGSPYLCYEILCIADILVGYFGKDSLDRFLKSLDYNYRVLYQLFVFKNLMESTKIFTIKGFFYRVVYHCFVLLINTTYKK